MTILTDEREERAARWLRQASERTSLIEPDWWLRMECGQVAEIVERTAAAATASC